MAEFAVTIIGSGSAVPMHGRHPSSQVVQYDESYFLIDCGEGTQLRFREMGIKPFRISTIFISHLHGDHVFGLPGLLSSFSHLGRTEPLTIYGPGGIRDFLQAIFDFTQLKIRYPLQIIDLNTEKVEPLFEIGGLEILTFPLKHRIACQGYLFREKQATIRVNKQLIEEKNLSTEQVKAGLRREDVLHGDEWIPSAHFFLTPTPPMQYAYCTDTVFNPVLAEMLSGVEVIYHEATFKNELSELAKETGHSTAGEAGSFAQQAGALCLILGHYSSRYKDLDELLLEAKVNFPNTILSEEGARYRLRDLI